MRVIINGAGIGGLTLAQALRGRHEVTVIERDDKAVSTGGYRLAITEPATAVLAEHLDRGLMAQLRAVSDATDRFAQFTIATDRMRPLIIDEMDAAEDRLLAQRRALRLLLTSGLDDSIRWSTRVTRVEQRADEALVGLDTGETLRADLVVGAEGAGSPTVRAVAAHRRDTDLGLIGIAGSAPRVAGAAIPRFLLRGPALVFSADGTGMFLSLTSTGTGALTQEVQSAVGPASLVWGLIAPARRVRGVNAQSPNELVATALHLTRRWHPWMAGQIKRTLRDRVAAFSFRAADPDGDLTPWLPRNITALGDAIHAMPPTGGQAASTAIRDAGELAEQLSLVERAEIPLDVALRRYHRNLRAWAVPALRESLGPVRVIQALGHPALASLARPVLAVAGGVARARG